VAEMHAMREASERVVRAFEEDLTSRHP